MNIQMQLMLQILRAVKLRTLKAENVRFRAFAKCSNSCR